MFTGILIPVGIVICVLQPVLLFMAAARNEKRA